MSRPAHPSIAPALFLAAAAAGALTSSPALAGTVTILSQDRFAEATVDGGDGHDEVTDRRTAPDAGTFDDTAEAEATGAAFLARASAAIVSSFAQDKLDVRGSLQFATQDARTEDNFVSADALFSYNVRFSIDEAYNFTFRNIVDEDATVPSGLFESQLRLTGPTGEAVAVPGDSGVIQPGNYDLLVIKNARHLSTEADVDTFIHTFDHSLDLSPVGGSNGGGEPNPIPLPPAAWSGLLVLGAAALARVRRRLFA